MSKTVANNKRIAKNTIMLYFRMLFLMVISLYTSRVILKALGVDDYGIYNVVGGFVAMFSMISTSLASAISRFITFSLAKDSPERVREVFSTSIIIQIALCILLLLIAETVGVWFINNKMVIPADRLFAANWVFQISVLTTMIQLISIPYNGLIIAHEKMSAFAFIGIYEGIVKLLIAFIIPFSPTDTLIFYAIMMFILSASVRFLYGHYCGKNFPECSFKFTFDRTLIKSMFGFAGWNFIGTTSGVLRSQGINILINIFCGPAVNAARGIAMQVNNAVSGFSRNFITAIRPQITKSYAVGDKASYENLVMKCSKFSFFILMILCVPIITEAEFIINLWLVEVPQYTIEFVCVILLLTMTDSYSSSLTTLLLATGKIKKYQILVGGIQLMNFPLAYVLLKLGFSPVSTVSSVIVISIICMVTRLYLLKTMTKFPIAQFYTNVVLKTILVFALCFIIIIPIKHSININDWAEFAINIVMSEVVCLSLIYTLGLTKSERKFVISSINKVIKRNH